MRHAHECTEILASHGHAFCTKLFCHGTDPPATRILTKVRTVTCAEAQDRFQAGQTLLPAVYFTPMQQLTSPQQLHHNRRNCAGAEARAADGARSPADAGPGGVLRRAGHPGAGRPRGAAVPDSQRAAAALHCDHAYRLALVRSSTNPAVSVWALFAMCQQPGARRCEHARSCCVQRHSSSTQHDAASGQCIPNCKRAC